MSVKVLPTPKAVEAAFCRYAALVAEMAANVELIHDVEFVKRTTDSFFAFNAAYTEMARAA